MIRRAFTMRLKPDASVEYRHHHDNIWPELVAEAERSGIASITTFQRDLDLFLVSEIKNAEAWNRLWNSEIHKRWAEVMEPLMHLRDDGIVDAGELTEIFHLETAGPRSAARGAGTKAKRGAATARRATGKKTRSAAGRVSGKKTAGASRKKAASAKTGARSAKKSTGKQAASGKKKRSARRN